METHSAHSYRETKMADADEHAEKKQQCGQNIEKTVIFFFRNL